MSTWFTEQHLKIFEIPTFEGRMPALKNEIRPILESFGTAIASLLKEQFKTEFFTHVAKHLRRKVNPPDETWVAFGPQKRGYKAYIFFSLCVGKNGAQVRVTLKDESTDRPQLGQNLIKNLKFFERNLSQAGKFFDYTRRNDVYTPTLITDWESFLREEAKRLQTLKSAVFDIGIEINPLSAKLEQDFLKQVQKLYPFYLCGLNSGVTLQ